MAFFEDLSRKVQDVAFAAAEKGKEVAAIASEKAQDAADTVKTNVAIAGEQDVAQRDGVAGVARQLLDRDLVSGGNPVLLAARTHYCEHGARLPFNLLCDGPSKNWNEPPACPSTRREGRSGKDASR